MTKSEVTGSMDRKIPVANFGLPTENNLLPGQYDRARNFLRWHNPPESTEKVDVIIVLTTSPDIDPVSYKMRLKATKDYALLYPGARILFSGKRPDASRATETEMVENYSEAMTMAKSAEELGLSSERFLFEEASLHTGQNIAKSLDFLTEHSEIPSKKLLVICSSYMARRVSYYLKRERETRCLENTGFIYDADVAQDLTLETSPLTEEQLERKKFSVLYEAKRLSRYRAKGDL